MTRSMADVLREEGEKKGKKEGEKKGEKKGEVRALRRVVLQLLRDKFGALPEQLEKTVKTTDRVELLEEWVRRVAAAPTLADMQIEDARA